MPHDVFLSYASADRAAATAVCAALEARGIRCWIAPRDVPAGADWGEAILTAIGRAHAMVLILSRQTANSVHVRNEVVTAVSQSLALVPVRIEDCQPAGALRLHLAGAHWLNVFPPPFAQHLDALVAGVRLALAADATIEIPREQAAAMVAAARASQAAAGPPPRPAAQTPAAMRPAPVAPAPAPRPATVPPMPHAGSAAGMAASVTAPHAAAAPRGPNRSALIAAGIAVVALVALGVAAWVFDPRVRALLGAAARLPATAAVTSAEAAPPAEEPRGLASGATLPGLGGSVTLPPNPAPRPAEEGAPRSLAPATPLPGLGGSIALPPPTIAPPVPAPGAPAIRPAPAPAAVAPPPSPAARVLNVASLTISRLYVARAADGIGREDWLGNAQITPGNAVLIRPPAGQGCVFNIRAVYVGGRTEDRPGVDVCAAPELRFEGGKATGEGPSR